MTLLLALLLASSQGVRCNLIKILCLNLNDSILSGFYYVVTLLM